MFGDDRPQCVIVAGDREEGTVTPRLEQRTLPLAVLATNLLEHQLHRSARLA